MRIPLRLLLPILLASSCPLSSCSDVQASSRGHRFSQAPTIANDAHLESSQIQLLKLSYQAASKFPINPHIKNRSRAQELVVRACFELDAPERALAYINGISNWRRGAGYADYAAHLAKHGDSLRLRTYLDKAIESAETAEDWRKHRIQAKVARVLLSLGKTERASALSVGLEPAEALALEATRVLESKADELASRLAWVDGAFEAGDLDQVQWALTACVRSYGDHYKDEEVRESIYERALNSLHKAPRVIGLKTLMDMAEVCLENEDATSATEILEQVNRMIAESEWLPEDLIPLEARTAQVTYAAGERDLAMKKLAGLTQLYQAKRSRIVDIFRCEALVPLAEAFWKCNDPQMAHKLYSMAVDEALVNPNARPRANDLIRIGCSMAVLGVVPGAEWLETYRQAVEQLDGPW